MLATGNLFSLTFLILVCVVASSTDSTSTQADTITQCLRQELQDPHDQTVLLQKDQRMVDSNNQVMSAASVLSSSHYLPINSAGEHTGTQKLIDVVLLVICLCVPFALFLIIRLFENRTSRSQSSTPDRCMRTGSSYHIESNQSSVKLTGPYGNEDPEGPPLQNILAGFSTAMAALPDAISFSFITGVSPLNGIWAGVFMGLSAALVGGRPGMISSASAATAVVLADVSLDPEMGMAAMGLCVFIVGILQLIAGCLRLSRFVTLIPHPVMLGFVNGLAIVMIRAQLRQFHVNGDGPWVDSHLVLSMGITALFAMFVAMVWARIPYAGKALPPPLASVVLTIVFSIALRNVLEPRTLRDVAGSHTFAGGLTTLPSWDFPPVGVKWHDTHMWSKVIATAVRFAVVGLLESLMTEALIDQITKTSGSMRRECFGQGVGNILASLFGTQGGCALIAQSLMNVGSGGRSRLSGITMGLTLALSVVLLAPIMAIIPVAALVGLITLIALNTFAWGSFELILRVNWIDSIVVVLVTVVTVWQDLATAVVTGVIINALGFAWHKATEVSVDSTETIHGEREFCLKGPLFFGSAMNFQSVVTKAPIAEKIVVLNFTGSDVLDISGIDAIKKAQEYLESAGKTVVIRVLSSSAAKDMGEDFEKPKEVIKKESAAKDDIIKK